MIRVLYLGAFSDPANTECHVANALELAGCTVERLEESEADLKDVVSAAERSEPDLFLFAKARFTEAQIGWPEAAAPVASMLQLVRPHVGKIVGWQFDLLTKEFALHRYQWAERVSPECDIFATTDGYTAPHFAESAVLRQGVPDDVDQDCPWDIEPEGDVLFLGNVYNGRQDFLHALESRFAGRFRHESRTVGEDLTRLVRSYRICVGPNYPYFANYWSNRIYVVTGHGGLFACPVVSGMTDDGWRAGQNYLALPYSVDSICDKLQEYLTKHDVGQLNAIRRAGFLHATANCSYDVRVRQLLAMVAAQTGDEEDSGGDENGEPEEPTSLESDEPTLDELVSCDLVQDFPPEIERAI